MDCDASPGGRADRNDHVLPVSAGVDLTGAVADDESRPRSDTGMFDDGHVGYVVEFQDGADVDGVGVAAKHIYGGDNEAFSGRDGLKNGVVLGKRVLGGESFEVLVESKADFAWSVVRVGCW